MYLGGVIGVFELVDFLLEIKVFAIEMGDERVLFGPRFNLDADGCSRAPRVAVEIAIDHLAILGPVVESIGCGVDADKSRPAFDMVHEAFRGGRGHAPGLRPVPLRRVP